VTENSSAEESVGDSLEGFIHRNSDSLARYIRSRVRGDVRATEDLVQETILHLVAYHGECGLPDGTEAVRLLFTIAYRRVIDWYDRAGKIELYPPDAVLLADATLAIEPTKGFDEEIVRQVDIERGLRRLTPLQRRALVLVYIDGMDYRTAATIMGLTVNGLKTHLRGAKARARQLGELNNYGGTGAAEGGA
jgi:RNA polymerase sigma factor (sigma-70 family)